MSFSTFRACVMMYALACGVSNVGAMEQGCSDSLAIPQFEPFSRAFIEGHSKIFKLMAGVTGQLKVPNHSRKWICCAYTDIAQDIFASIFPRERTEPLSFEEEQGIICATRKRMREHEALASRVVDDLMNWCMRMQQNQIKRSCRGSISDTDDF